MPKGYRLPDPVDPEDVACMKLYYPNAPEYIAALWGSLGYLTQWSAWERDDSQSAKSAAFLWKDAIAQSRADFDEGRNCECDVEPYQGQDGTEELADYLWALRVVIETIAEQQAAGGTYLQFQQWYLTQFGIWPANSYTSLWDYEEDYTEAEIDSQVAAAPWQSVYDETWCYAESVCSSDSYLMRFPCWAQEVSAKIANALEEASSSLLNALGTSIGLLNSSLNDGAEAIRPTSSKYLGDGSYWSFSTVVCYWEHTINLKLTDGGFYLFPAPWNGGFWSSGTGWKSELCVPDTYRTMHYIQLDFPASATIHEITHNYSLTKGDWLNGSLLAYAARLKLSSSYVFSGWEKSYNWCVNRSEYDEVIDIGGIVADNIEIFGSSSRGYDYESGLFYTHSITIKGSGDNPWE